MGTKKTAPQEEEPLKEDILEEASEAEVPQEEEPKKAQPKPEKKKEAVIPPEIDNLLRLYPQYKKLWVTKEGFVHPEGVSKHYTGNATLYENKYYKQ